MSIRTVEGVELGFRALRRKLQNPQAKRGTTDLAVVQDCIIESWDGLNSELNSLPTDEQENMKKHFNELVEDKDLGELLFGSADAFHDEMCSIQDEDKKIFFDELFKTEIISEP